MKRISLVALTATAAMAQVPAVSTPAASSASAGTTAGEIAAPLAPVHDELVQWNPAVPRSIGALVQTPSLFLGQRAAAFQWDGGAASYNGVGLAVVDQFFTGFNSVEGKGNLAGGYIASGFGVGANLHFQKEWTETDVGVDRSTSTSLKPSGFGVFGSMGRNDLLLYGHADWYTPIDYTKTTVDDNETGNRGDAIKVGIGAKTAPKGDLGISWNAALDYAYYEYRTSGTNSSKTKPLHTIHQLGQLGKTFSADGFVLAAGVDEKLGYYNALGTAPDTGNSITNIGSAIDGPDYGYEFSIEPTLAIIIPIFERWTLKGGAKGGLHFKSSDELAGDDYDGAGELLTNDPTGSVGIRYSRSRWAAEAQITKGFLNRGPYFVSGSGDDMFASFAITANFK